MNILIVDDGATARDLLRRILTKEGHHVLSAGDGLEALEELRRELVDVILADIMMPQMDGYRLCQAVRRDERLKQIPFIIYTANYGTPADEQMALDLGADAFLHKPATSATILETLRRVMSQPRGEPPRPVVEQPEAVVMQEYTNRMVAKLEQRNSDLAALNETLRASEERFAKAFQACPVVVNVATVRDGRLLMVNDCYCQFFGYTRAEAVGRTALELGIYSDFTQRAPLIERLLAQGSVRDYEVRLRRKDGSVRDGLVAMELITYPGEAEPVLISMFTDITERKQAGEALARERSLLRTVIDLVPDHIYVKDTASRFLLANLGVARAMGAAQPELLLGKSDRDFYPPEACAMFASDEQEVLAGRAVLNKEEPVTHPDGTERFILTTKVPLQDDAGNIIGLVGIGRDFTAHKQAEVRLQDSERLYHSLVVMLPQNIFRKDREGRFTFANARFCQTIGRPQTEVVGRTDAELFPPELAAKYRADDVRVMTTGQPYQTEEEHPDADGQPCFVEVNKAPIRDAAGQVVGIQGVFTDITERKQAAEVLQQRTAELERFHRLSVGRELRMVELKQEVNALAQAAGRTPPYDLSFLENFAQPKGQP